MNKKLLAVFITIFTILVLTVLLTRPCDWYWLTDKFTPGIQFNLPNGFSGRIFLIDDEKNGTKVIESDKRYMVNIPPNGILHVKPIPGISDRATKLYAFYSDGSSVSILNDRSSTIKGKTVHSLIIGNEKEINEQLMDVGSANELLNAKQKTSRSMSF